MTCSYNITSHDTKIISLKMLTTLFKLIFLTINTFLSTSCHKFMNIFYTFILYLFVLNFALWVCNWLEIHRRGLFHSFDWFMVTINKFNTFHQYCMPLLCTVQLIMDTAFIYLYVYYLYFYRRVTDIFWLC